MLKYLAVICLVFFYCHHCESSLTVNANKRSIKIAGGTAASDHEYPFIISIQKQLSSSSYEHLCTGSILSSTWILTAAHCVDSSTLVVVYGTNDNSCKDGSCKYIKVKNQLIHPSYDSKTYRHDIAVFELESALPIDDSTIAIVSIDGNSIKVSDSESDSSRIFIVSGWGGLNEQLDYPKKLQHVSLPIVDMTKCASLEGIETEQICAGSGAGEDACSGDSGGPLFRKLSDSNMFTQFGVVSSGSPKCGAVGSRGIYSNTTFYLPFIKTYVPGVSVNYDSNTVNPGTISGNAVSHFGLLSVVILFIGSLALL